LVGKIESLLPLVRIKHDKDFTWGIEQKEAFECIKEYLTKPPVLQAPKNGGVYIAASDGVMGAMLAQENKGKEGAIAYMSRRLLSAVHAGRKTLPLPVLRMF
jgi:ABC-type sugar transport system substrate-binding protein